MGYHDIEQIIRLFSIIQNIQVHGTIGDDVKREWVSVEQIYQKMPQKKIKKA